MSSTTTPRTKKRYYKAISNIEALIENLDTEVFHYCKQRSVTNKPTNFIGSDDNEYGSLENVLAGSAPDVDTKAQSTLRANEKSHISKTLRAQLHKTYRERVIDAYRHRRIFTVFGNYHTIRYALLRRGWLEKLPPNRLAKLQSFSEETLLEQACKGNDYEVVLLSKMINTLPASFIWQSKKQSDICIDALTFQNCIRRTSALDFSTKVGLVGCAEQESWFREDGICGMTYPRFYRLGSKKFEEQNSFIEDFQNTQARSLLYFIRDQDVSTLIDTFHGTVPTSVIDYALQFVKNEIHEKEHCTLDDVELKQPTGVELMKRNTLMINSTEILNRRARFKTNAKTITEYALIADKYLKTIEKLRPDYLWDGHRNLWILKPGFLSRGNGIVIHNSLDYILKWTATNPNRKYIVQKYIERPLLIHRTKFDIRQYMLLTVCESKINIWMYRDCYLRFSSQEFTMDDLRDCIHLTNNSVQKRYTNNEYRNPHLPRHNMWSLKQFKLHLKQINAPEYSWYHIYNGFKQNLIAVVMASLDETEIKPNSFELYGCDFMIDECYKPILIEINSTPDLSSSTDITARICPMVLKDVVRVVVDLARNVHASTGLFESVYELNYRTNSNSVEIESIKVAGTPALLHKTIGTPHLKAAKSARASMRLSYKTKTS